MRNEKAEIVKSNANPSVALKRANPDSSTYQFINKAQLLYHTSEFIFSPLGRFEIISLGQIFSKDNLLAQRKIFAEVKVFDTLVHKTQRDFEYNNTYSYHFWELASAYRVSCVHSW